MNTNKSTPAQRGFIESLAKGKTMDELEVILAPAFRINSNSFSTVATLNQNLARLTKTAASSCISILQNMKINAEKVGA
jgi:hypothetical protein